MTVFWGLAGLMVIMALLFTLPALFAGKREEDADLDTVNTEVIKAQLAELEADLENGRLDEARYLAAREDLERELLADLSGASTGGATNKVRSGRWAALVLVLLVPGLTFWLYYQVVGTRQIIPLLVETDAPQASATVEEDASFDELVQRLADRMQQQPENAEGWVMLARSYATLQRFDDAAGAYEKAHQLLGDQAGLLADYADVLVMASGGKFTDEAGALLLKAVEADPDHVKALWLAGHWKNQQAEYADAVHYWQRVETRLPPDGKDAEVIALQISQAHAQLAPGEVIETPAPRQETAVAGRDITVSVTLDPQLADSTAPEDTVFIFARAVSGPRMPLAIVRKQVSDLPVTVNLDDSMAMAPGMKLSNFDEVAVGARISKSGTAMPQSGDLQGELTHVATDSAQAVELNINSRVP